MTLAAETSDFSSLAAAHRQMVNAALARYSEYGDDTPRHLADAIRHSLLAPGTRLRPLLVLMASQACGYDPRAALPAACAVEMIHTYSLIHDDLPGMDDATRSGDLPAVYADLIAKALQNQSAEKCAEIYRRH